MSTGFRIYFEEGKLVVQSGYGTWYVDDDDAANLKKQFLKDRDKELGRWRSKDQPHFFVQQRKGTFVNNYLVFNERDSSFTTFGNLEAMGKFQGNDDFGYVAREYFAANPEEKAWDKAKPGDVWKFRTSKTGAWNTAILLGDMWCWTTNSHAVNLRTIVEGKKLHIVEDL